MEPKAAYEQLEQRIEDLEDRLTEREKELNCLYELSRLIEDHDILSDDLLQELPFLLQSSWQHPEATCARLVIGDRAFVTHNFRATKWRQIADIVSGGKQAGRIEVYSIGDGPASGKDPFIEEERRLIDAVAERLGKALERRQWEEETRLQWEQFAAIIDNFAHSLYISDPSTYEVLLVNKTLEAKLGKNPVGGLCYEELQGRSTPCEFCTNDIILNKKGPYVWEHYNPVLKKDLLLTDQIIRWPDGRSVRYEIGVDISERKKMEAELRDTKTFLEKIFSSMPDAVFVVDPGALTITTCNPAARSIFGYTKNALIGEYLERLHVDKDMYEAFGRELFAALEAEGIFRTEYRMRRKDGSIFYTENTVTEIVDNSGGRTGLVNVVRDITPRVRAEKERDQLQAELLQSQKMESLGTLAGGIAHDFNNILMPITLNTELVLRHTDEQDEAYGYLKDMLQAARHGRELVKQITTFSRRGEQKREAVGIAPVVKEALKLIKASLPPTIEVTESIDEDAAGFVMADPTQIHQVLMNLCTNAAHSIGEGGGRIGVNLANMDVDPHFASTHPDLEPGGYLKMSVSDTGEGIIPETRERIFEPFFTTKERSEGTGMGLSVVHGIVKSHGGAITVDSESGRGSVFNVFLPRVEEASPQEASPPMDAPTGRGRILLVDDEDTVLRSEKTTLESLGYEVVPVSGGEAALELFRARPGAFDLVLTDQAMPAMTGLELCRALLRIRSNTPIILCTGLNTAVDRDKALAEGIREFVMKPFNTREIAETVRRAIEA